MTENVAVAVRLVVALKVPNAAAVDVIVKVRLGSGVVFEPDSVWKLAEELLPIPVSPAPDVALKFAELLSNMLLTPTLVSSNR